MIKEASIQITPDIGQLIKNLRVEHQISTNCAAAVINKQPPYLSKLEKGMVKKIRIEDFKKLIAYIFHSNIYTEDSNETNETLIDFCRYAYDKLSDSLDSFSKITIMNLDAVYYKYTLSNDFIAELNEMITRNCIETIDIFLKVDSINHQTEKQIPKNEYAKMSPNLFYRSVYSSSPVIRYSASMDEIDAILNRQENACSFVVIYPIIWAVFYSINGRPSINDTMNFLQKHSIEPEYIKYARSKYMTSRKNTENYIPNEEILKCTDKLIENINRLASTSTEYTLNNLEQMLITISNDLSFAFSYFGMDLSCISNQSRERKIAFLDDLNKLIKQYNSKKDEPFLYT